MKISPVILFVYNRLNHTIRTVEALQKNTLASETELIIFSDAAKSPDQAVSVTKVRTYLHTVTGFKKVSIVERAINYGLAGNVIDGVTTILNRYPSVIVLEDDLVTSPYFLKYMNEALTKYENIDRVVSIHGYVYPVAEKLPETFFLKGADCWGWATWKRGWNLFEKNGQLLLETLVANKMTKEFDNENSYPFTKMLSDQIKGKNNSWAIRWHASTFIKNKFTLYPGRSLVQNIGNDSSGVHSESSNVFDVHLSDSSISIADIHIEENIYCRNAFKNYFNSIKPGFWTKVYYKFKSIAKNAFTK